MLVIEWIIIGFFSAIGWKGADYMFEKLGTEPTQIVKKDEQKDRPVCEPPKVLNTVCKRSDERPE